MNEKEKLLLKKEIRELKGQMRMIYLILKDKVGVSPAEFKAASEKGKEEARDFKRERFDDF